ncbi:hypothetical protein, partial [Amycolatopsis azurea]
MSWIKAAPYIFFCGSMGPSKQLFRVLMTSTALNVIHLALPVLTSSMKKSVDNAHNAAQQFPPFSRLFWLPGYLKTGLRVWLL